jgi:glycosyltransferase involved in cell wall biosynthesis
VAVSVIIPAYNEASRVALVVKAAVSAGYHEVLVVNDGSKDNTAEVAANAGARVLTLNPNRRKGGAMKAGLAATTGDTVLFLDADMVGFNSKNLHLMTDPVESGEYDQIIGIADESNDPNAPDTQPDNWEGQTILSGQRALKRKFLEMLPDEAWDGYGIEVWLNDVVQRYGGKTGVFKLNRVFATLKWEKEGAAVGFAKMADMMAEVFRAIQRIIACYESKDMNYQKAPVSQTLEAQCSSTQCVADAISQSIRRAMWTDDVQERFSNRISTEVSKPLWIGTGCLSFFFFGPAGAAVAGFGYAASKSARFNRGRPARF